MLTESETLLQALQSGLNTLTHFLDNLTTWQSNFVTIALPSGDTINKALDVSPHGDQEESILIMRRLSVILESYPNTNIILLWLPSKINFEGFRRAKQLALDTICTANINKLIEPHTINNQQEMIKNATIVVWTEKWH